MAQRPRPFEPAPTYRSLNPPGSLCGLPCRELLLSQHQPGQSKSQASGKESSAAISLAFCITELPVLQLSQSSSFSILRTDRERKRLGRYLHRPKRVLFRGFFADWILKHFGFYVNFAGQRGFRNENCSVFRQIALVSPRMNFRIVRVAACTGLAILFAGCAERALPEYEPPLKRTQFMKVRTTAYTHTESDHLRYGKSNAMGTTLLGAGEVRSAAADWARWPAGTQFVILSTGQVYQVDDYGWDLSG